MIDFLTEIFKYITQNTLKQAFSTNATLKELVTIEFRIFVTIVFPSCYYYFNTLLDYLQMSLVRYITQVGSSLKNEDFLDLVVNCF